jgi:TolB-like protein
MIKGVTMRRTYAALLFAALSLLAAGCATVKDAGKALDDASWELVEAFPSKGDHTVAVYYFTEDGKVSAMSEYVINRMTTEIANAIREEKLNCLIVSRNTLDRLIEEQAFQVSEFTDPVTQIAIGKQLGADLIITGTITPFSSEYEINAQVIDIQTARVLGGCVRSFSNAGR